MTVLNESYRLLDSLAELESDEDDGQSSAGERRSGNVLRLCERRCRGEKPHTVKLAEQLLSALYSECVGRRQQLEGRHEA